MPVPPACPVQLLTDFAQLRQVAGTTPAGAAPDVFQDLLWFETLARHGFVDGVVPVLACVRDARSGTAFTLPLAQADQGLRSLSNYYSSLYGPIGADAQDAASWHGLAQSLKRLPHGSVLDLQPLAEDGAFLHGLSAGLRAAGYWVGTYRCFGNWYLPVVDPDFAAYHATLPSPLRHSIARGRRRLQREDGFGLAVHTHDGPGLDQAIADFEAVYRQSWKQPEPCPAFMPGLMRTAAAQGWLRLGVLHVHGQPVAAQVWLVYGGKANIYKLAYVQGFERFSPGSVLTAAMMEHVLDRDGVREVDYLTGDDAYKRDWMRQRRARVGLVAFDPLRPRGLAAATRHFGARALRRLQAAWRRQPSA